MMKTYNNFLLAFMVLSFTEASYAGYQTVVLKDNGVNAQYRKVPSDFKCNIPNKDNALCFNSKKIQYFSSGQLHFGEGYLNIDEYLNYFKGLLKSRQVTPLKTYITPGLSQHIAQEDSKMLIRRGLRVTAITIETEKVSEDRLGLGVVIFKFSPNNGVPVTEVSAFSASYPKSLASRSNQIKKDFFVFMNSSRYDKRYIQTLNTQHSQFSANLNASEERFYNRQGQIGKGNIDALDIGMNGYRKRARISDSSHTGYIGSIHEKRKMTDYNTGQQYDVYGNYNNNYVNPYNNSQQIQTNDSLYNPNINNNAGEYYNRLE